MLELRATTGLAHVRRDAGSPDDPARCWSRSSRRLEGGETTPDVRGARAFLPSGSDPHAQRSGGGLGGLDGPDHRLRQRANLSPDVDGSRPGRVLVGPNRPIEITHDLNDQVEPLCGGSGAGFDQVDPIRIRHRRPRARPGHSP